MIREKLINLLGNYSPSDEERLFYTQMLDFIRQEERCFERSLECGHMTASAWLLGHTGEEALLLLHAKLNRWVQPGGHADGNSDLLSVAIQEAQEESGITSIEPIFEQIFDIDIHEIPENPKEKAHVHYDVRFLLRVTSDAPLVQNRESKAMLFYPKEKKKLPTQDRSVVRLFDKWSLFS